MKILVVSDLHYSLKQWDWLVEQAESYRIVVVAGDLLDVGAVAPLPVQKIAIMGYLKRLAPRTRLVVCSGNHDLDALDPRGEAVADWLRQARRNGVWIDGEGFDLEGVRFTVCPWWDGPEKRRDVRDLVAQEAEPGRRARRWVWVHHAPPQGSRVSWTRKTDGGDAQVRELIEEFQPDIVVSGHIHLAPFYDGGSWRDRIGRTWIFNPGRQIGSEPTYLTIDFDSGRATWHSLEGQGEVDLDQAP